MAVATDVRTAVDKLGGPTGLEPQQATDHQMSVMGVRRDKAAFFMGASPTRQLSLQPEATGAVMEVTKWLKPLV